MIFEVFFDVETKNLFRDTQTGEPQELGVSIVSVFSRTLDETFHPVKENLHSFWEHELADMWYLFEKADRIVGFNSINFDIPVLTPYAPSNFKKLKHFDLLDIIKTVSGRRFSLNHLASTTLGQEKTDIGTNAVQYWRKGDRESLTKLRKYCEADVLLTRDLYDFGITHKHIKYTDRWNNIKIIEVDFSYPKEITDAKQFSLF